MNFPVNQDNVAFGPVCLVTGGAGFVGSFLIRRLLDLGLEVRSFDLKAPPLEHERLTAIVGDIRDAEQVAAACKGVDTVFHTAAIICLLGRRRKAVSELSYGVNITGTKHLLAAAQAAGVKQFVHTSSHNVIMDREIRGGDERERYAQTYIDLYTETKVPAEEAVLAADNPSGMRTAAVRPGGIWGPGAGAVMIEKFVEQLALGKFVAVIGNGKAKTDTTHVQNVVDAEILAAQKLATDPKDVGGQAYFITDDEPFNQMEWFRPLTEALGYDFPKRKIPSAPLRLVAGAMEWFHYLGGPEPLLTRSAIWKVSKDFYVEIDKAKRELGYVPRVQRDSGLEELLPHARETLERYKAAAGKS